MRASRAGVIILIMGLSGAAFAQESDRTLLAPLPVRDQFLLNNGFFFFEPEDAAVMDNGDTRLTINAADANTFAKSAWISRSLADQNSRAIATRELANSRFQGEGPLFLADGETHRIEFAVHRAVADHLEIGVTVPVSTIGGGWSDRFIELTHNTLGIGNANRQALRQNSQTVYINTGSVHYLQDRSAGYALGDIALTAKYELTPLEGKDVAMSVVGAVELPTGNAQTLDGSGSVDAGVQLIISREMESSRIHFSAGMLRLGGNRPLGTQAQIVMTNTIAASRMISDRTSATLQLTLSECPFRHLGLAELTRRSNQLSAGIQHQIGRSAVVYVAFIENVLNYENSADAGLAWGIARRF